jgi:mannose-1-phosphate guanylyltransferase
VLPQLPPENLVAEPAARNTAAAVGLGAAVVARRAGPGAVLAVLPADHHIGDEPAFAATLRTRHRPGPRGHRHRRHQGPTHPETGFGYISRGRRSPPASTRWRASWRSPTPPGPPQYLAAGTYLWNSGMFFFSAGRLLAEARRHLPGLGAALDALVAASDFPAALRALYPGVPAISIDYGIMEKTAGIRVDPRRFRLERRGQLGALPNIRAADGAGNVVSGDTVVAESRGSIVLAEPGAPSWVWSGVDDLVVIATADAVLVVPKDRAQEVRRVVTPWRRPSGKTCSDRLGLPGSLDRNVAPFTLRSARSPASSTASRRPSGRGIALKDRRARRGPRSGARAEDLRRRIALGTARLGHGRRAGRGAGQAGRAR